MTLKKFRKIFLMNGNFSQLQPGNLLRVIVDGNDLVAEFGKAGRGY